MIFPALRAALGQLGDRRFLRVVLLGVGLTLFLLVATYAAFVGLILRLTPGQLWLPWAGNIQWVHAALSLGTLALVIGLSVFLMVPVAAMFSSLFLDDVAQAVEDRHYPGLPLVPHRGLIAELRSAAGFLGVVALVNLLALLGYFLSGPLAPVFFWAVNGYLLGREYFQTVAERRLGPAAARRLRRAHFGTVWLAGALMAVPLSLPLVNLLVPVLGVATFTHIFHRLAGR